jgi:hypothetical protein
MGSIHLFKSPARGARSTIHESITGNVGVNHMKKMAASNFERPGVLVLPIVHAKNVAKPTAKATFGITTRKVVSKESSTYPSPNASLHGSKLMLLARKDPPPGSVAKKLL